MVRAELGNHAPVWAEVMSWVGQIVLGAYLVFILGTAVGLFAAILVATAELPVPGAGNPQSKSTTDGLGRSPDRGNFPPHLHR